MAQALKKALRGARSADKRPQELVEERFERLMGYGKFRKRSPAELPAGWRRGRAIFPGAHLALGLSGGIDSVALLDILVELAPGLRFSLRAVHVNHGISPHAGRWAEFCARLCAKSHTPLQLESVDIAPYRDLGLEGAARRARYEAFARVDADFIVLAQHRDDQADTLLLRLLRGSCPRVLAYMYSLASFADARPRRCARFSISCSD
jgi:tRNA(Ile)-lysidine synthase